MSNDARKKRLAVDFYPPPDAGTSRDHRQRRLQRLARADAQQEPEATEDGPSAPSPPDIGQTRPRATPEKHADLLGRGVADPGRRLDAIVVSAYRPAQNLAYAVELAAAAGCRLVMLCSGAAKPADVVRMAQHAGDMPHAVVAIPHGYTHPLLELRTNARAEAGGLGDLSVKRNVALLLAHLAGWGSIFLLDDDIFGVTSGALAEAVAALPQAGAVGMPAREFPDNSIVCHANRRTGYEQDVFVSASALVVDCQEVTSFFPRIYNEDWLFMAPAVARSAVVELGSARQLPYAPFADPERAADQEFGNVVADGLMSLLHRADLGEAERPDYWHEFLSRRKAFIGGIAGRTRAEDLPVLAALAAAERRRASISTAELAEYVTAWRQDRLTWREGLVDLPRGLAFTSALRQLGLAQGAHVSASFDGPAPAVEETGSVREGQVGTQGRKLHGILAHVSARLLQEGDWRRLRQVRLAALQESPQSFLSTYEEEAVWTDAQWRSEAARGWWLVDMDRGRSVAMLGATPESDIAASERYLSYLWVAPDHRRRGLGKQLVADMLDRLRAAGVPRAWLWVLGGNLAARRLYEGLGFVSTGERQPLKNDPMRYEERMTLALE
jgi:ribosomal protein S18 acetylase RimI-like enzyme